MLVERLLSQGYRYEMPEKFIQKVLWQISRSNKKCQRSVSDIVRDSFPSDAQFKWIVIFQFGLVACIVNSSGLVLK